MTTYINAEREREQQARIDTSRSSLLVPISAGIGAIILGTTIFSGRLKVSRTTIADALHYLGHGRAQGFVSDIDMAARGTISSSKTAGIRSLVGSSTYDVVKNKLRIESLDLINDLRNSVDILGNVRVDVGQKIAAKTTEFINEKNLDLGPYNSFFGHDLQRITVKEVLADANNWKEVIGKQQFDILNKAKRIGLVSDSTFLDAGLYKNLQGEIVDARLSSAFGKKSILGKLTGGINPFGQVDVFRSLIGTNVGVAVLGRTEGYRGNRFFIGGTVYGYDDIGKETVLGTGRKLRLAGDPLDAVTAARKGTLGISRSKIDVAYANSFVPSPLRSGLASLEQNLGVGIGYAVRPSFFDRFIVNPIRRFSSLMNESGVIYKHKNAVEGKLGKFADWAVGGELPELISTRGKIVPISGGGKVYALQDLNLIDRLAVLFDLKKDFSVVDRVAIDKAKTGKYILSNKDLVVPLPEGALESLIKPISGRLRNVSDIQTGMITKAGDVIASSRAKYYEVERSRVLPWVTSTRDFVNYLFYRVNSLASESLLGVGFAPGKNVLTTAARLATIPLIYEAGREGLEYADYLSEKLTGVSPKKFVASLYANARLIQQSIRQALGIQQAASSAESLFPGSIDSEGSFIARSAVLPAVIAGSLAGLGKAKLGLGLAGLSYLLFGGPKPGQTIEELKSEYAGESKVPVRKGRFWGMGYTSLFGGAPEYYDFSWYHKLQTDINYIGNYGSKEEYFKYHQNVFGIPLPTPSNLFGLNNLINPYRWEDMHALDRPYPVTGNQLENFPIFGPILGATLGRALKPTRYNINTLPLLKAGLVDKGLEPSSAQALGIPARDASQVQIDDPNDPLVRLNQFLNVGLEPIGVYKFALEYYGLKLDSTNPRLASSDVATSEGRAFYAANLGGLAGQSELLRRFMLSDYYNAYHVGSLVNNIPNNLPDFLPGIRSSIAKDRSYMKDFTVGDAYSSIPGGEYRLPGDTYRRTHKMHSSEGYDLVDQFLILSDVAPYSEGYNILQKKVLKMNLDDYWRKQVETAIKQRNAVIGLDDRYPRITDELININEQTKSSGFYRSARSAYDTITHDFLAEIPYFGSKFFPFRSPYEQYRKLEIEGAPFPSWDRPYENVIRPMFYDMALEDPLTAAMKGGTIGALLYGPLRLFSPVKNLEQSLGMNVLVGATAGSALSIGSKILGADQNYIPYHIRKESELIEYTDKFSYLKNRMYAEEGGGGAFSNAARKTMVGASSPIMIRASLPKSSDRRYFDYFMKEPDQAQILGGVTSYMRDALLTAQGRDYPSKQQADQAVLDYFSVNELPSSDYAGWHPNISTSANRLNFINHGINGVSDNFHRFGFFDSQINELKYRLPDLYNEPIRFQQATNYGSIRNFIDARSDIRGSLNERYSTSTFGIRGDADISEGRTYYVQDLIK